MNICIGIDPSMNSSGLTILYFDENNECVKEKFYIVKNGHLTKREKEAQEKYSNCFQYLLYDRLDPATAEDNHESERWKTLNMLAIIDTFKSIVDKEIEEADNVYILQEGISYGSSIRTKSVFDLAGLNYLLRSAFIKNDNVNFTIATPAEVKKFATGSGNCKKEQMVELFKITHDDFDLPKIDDISDAYWMAMYAKKLMFERI